MRLHQVIKQIGLSGKHALVYELLLDKPNATPLQLARETKLNRSSLYRYLEELREKGLVQLLLGDKSSRYRANPDGLSQYLMSEESRVENLKKTIPALVSELAKTSQGAESEVKYFQGVEGLKQMLWNVVDQKDEFLGLGYQDWNTTVGKNYADKLRQKMLDNKVISREILNQVDDTFGYTSLGKSYTQVYEHRAIDPKVLEIKHDTYIYGDVFAYYYHYEGEYFGVEIHNKEIAKTERHMFEILWRMAK
ncbi:MAG: helix-turn-helix domain-containing protein [Microgenomates group bacterium]